MQADVQAMSIQDFQKLMQSNEKKELPVLLQKLAEIAKPEDVRVLKAASTESWGWL